MTDMLTAALEWHAAGFSVIRSSLDGSKAPLGQWKQYQTERASTDQLREWFKDGYPGLGIVCGAVSGNVELLEFEGRAVNEGVFTEFEHRLAAAGHAETWEAIKAGYLELSPGGGLHFLYRVDGTVDGNVKLAQRFAFDHELTDDEHDMLERTGKRARRTLIETRGERGQVVVWPSHGPTHPTGKPWLKLDHCSPATVITIPADVRDMIHILAHDLDQVPPPAPLPETFKRDGLSDGDLHPGEDFNQRATWPEILEPHGWTLLAQRGSQLIWRRPGKRHGPSAVSGSQDGSGRDFLYVYTTSTVLPDNESMSKWRVYAMLNHGGDFSAAASELRRLGYGTPHTTPYLGGFDDVGLFSRPADHTPMSPAPAGWGPLSVNHDRTPTPDLQLEVPTVDRDAILAQRLEQLTEFEVMKLKARREAKRRVALDDSQNIGTFEGIDMETFVAEINDEHRYLIEGLWPEGARILLAAQFKSGKTTLTSNLIRSLVDGDDFLERFKVLSNPRVAVIDTEMTKEQLQTWTIEQDTNNLGNAMIFPMRGKVSALNFLDEDCLNEMAAKLRAFGADVLILDCLRPVLDALGLSEDHDAGRFFVRFDELLRRAGINNGLIVHHMGHQNERSRGDSRIRDWPDVEWKLVRKSDNPNSDRYFSAFGRDVDVEESKLEYNSVNRHLKIAGGSRRDDALEEIYQACEIVLTLNEDGLSKNKLVAQVVERVRPGRDRVREAIDTLIDKGRLLAINAKTGLTIRLVTRAINESDRD